MLEQTKNVSSIFHLLIIAVFMLGFSGCGYKANPYLDNEAPEGDENVEFIIKEPTKR